MEWLIFIGKPVLETELYIRFTSMGNKNWHAKGKINHKVQNYMLLKLKFMWMCMDQI